MFPTLKNNRGDNMNLNEKAESLSRFAGSSAWATRILCELNFARGLSAASNGAYDEIIGRAADTLLAASGDDGVITKKAALEAEQILMPLQGKAKALRVHCVSHAHIDMNWMWGYPETVSVTVDTFRTVLDLMKEYPDFTFAQSQASTYEIIEKYAPEMLGEIRGRVREGRWEVSASTWVETDKNMPNGESLARHILYTKRYLSRLLDIPAESLELDFEPDTFGHNITVPEICAGGGVKYYYHCRGNGEENNDAYVWRARSGAELLVYRDRHWYNGTIEYDMFRDIPLLCNKMGTDCFLTVYGVGDHGGGPTRRDIERLIGISSWSVMPTVMFSTYSKFFGELESFRSRLPVREGELNFIFNGCYTSQSRIKMANRIAEDRIYESEALGAAASMISDDDFRGSFEKAWRKILFNHFHDILPGSGVMDTREYAMGRFQGAMAAIGTNANRAMRAIAEQIDTSPIICVPDGESISEGAGVGFEVDQKSFYAMPHSERGSGKKRIFHLFNTTQYDYDGVTEITVFDWNFDANRAVFAGADGAEAACKLLSDGSGYWGHSYKKYAVMVKVPAFGWATYTLDARCAEMFGIPSVDGRTDDYTCDDIILENGLIKAVFRSSTMELLSLTDKSSGTELVSAPSCFFRLITENTVHGMTSWIVGEYMTVKNLNAECNVRVSRKNIGGVRQSVSYEFPFGTRSKLGVTVSLDEGSSMLVFDTMIDFHEIGDRSGVQQVNFFVPVGYAAKSFRYDVPFGTVDRGAIDSDVPANSFAAALPENGQKCAVMLISDSKYGFRGANNAVALSLVRASYEPDPYPEDGIHNMRIGVGVAGNTDNGTLYKMAARFVHPVSVCSSRGGKGTLPPDCRLLKVEGNVRISSVKAAEDFKGLTIRLSDGEGQGSEFSLSFAKKPAAAFDADINENIRGGLQISGNSVNAFVKPYGVKTVLVKFE